MDVEMDINKKNKYSYKDDTNSGNREGIVRIGKDVPRPEQEKHNANHVLYYFVLIIHSITWGIRKSPSAESASRIERHLSCLKEFIECEDRELDAAIDALLTGFRKKLPVNTREWIAFVTKNAEAISIMAKRYGGVKNEELLKMKDLYESKHWFRAWWWKVKIEKFGKKISKWTRSRRRRTPVFVY